MTGPSDFVEIQLSASGIAFAGAGGTVRVSNGHFSYSFTAGTPVRVLASEWQRVLSLKTFNGQPILEVAPAAAPIAAPIPAPAPAPAQPVARVISAPAAHTDAPEPKTEVK